MREEEREKGSEEEELDIYRYKPESGVKYTKHGVPERIQTYWRKLMDSTQKRMSHGAVNIARMISWARRENWRRGGEGNREKKK
ncbi:hypothetical protein E3J79_00740 [Candidatus Dependentiae bacterium]|nr:MAG: hypothetical protein E3J79_00740 [Candidatus Dependentiae bacterium]